MSLSKLQIMEMNKNWRNFRLEDVETIDEKSKASKEAEEQGLVHLGFGRYGPKRGDPATHVSKDGELKPVSDKEPEVDGGEPEDKPFGGDTGKDADFQGEPPEGLREPDEEKPKEKRPGGKQAEDDYHKADMMMKKHAGRDIEKAEYWAKKKRQAADAMMGRTGTELGENWMKEIMKVSNIKSV